jgi:hypothetical protein
MTTFFPDGYDHIPGNPYALVKNNIIVEMFYAQYDSEERIIERLKEHTYDFYINCTEYGQQLCVGDSVTEDGYVRSIPSYPSWVWNNDLRTWESPKGPHPKDGQKWAWDEDSLGWVVCGSQGTIENDLQESSLSCCSTNKEISYEMETVDAY